MDDLRAAIRALWRARGSSALAVLTLGLGLGANTALFSLVHASLFRPLPFAAADRVVRIWEVTREDPTGSGTLAPGDVFALAHASREFEAFAGYRSTGFNLEGRDEPERVPGAVVSPSFFRVFAVQPRVGRVLQEASSPGVREAMLSESLWRRRFAASPDVVGQTIELGGEPVMVTGIVPAGFEVPAGTELWLTGKYWVPENPLRPGTDVSSSRSSHYLFAAGRLRTGASPQSAAAEINGLARSIAPDDPNLAFRVVGFREDLVGPVRPRLLLLLGAVGLVLFLACTNVASLLLAQSLRHRHELAVRIALGASRWQLVRLHLVRGLLLSAAGALLGVFLAAFTPPLLVVLGSPGLRAADLQLSPEVLAATCVLALGTTLLVSVLPVMATSVTGGELRAGPVSAGRHGVRLRNLLIAAEVALAFVLLVSAGLLIRSVARLERVEPGFRSGRVSAGFLSLPPSRYGSLEAQRSFLEHFSHELASSPDLEAHAFASHIPLGPGELQRAVEVPGLSEPVDVDFRLVSPGYVETLGVPLLAGRSFRAGDEETPVLLVNAQFARRYFPGTIAVDRTLIVGDRERRVVGVVADVVQSRLDRPPRPEIFFPLGSEPWPGLTVLVRSHGAGAPSASTVRRALQAVDSRQALSRFGALDGLVQASISDRRHAMELLAVLGALAILLAAIGIYGILAETVAQRTRELGIRLALGSTARGVLWLVVLQSMKQVAAGLVLGAVAAQAAGSVLAGLLFEVGSNDALTYGAAALTLGVVTLLASGLGGRAASSLEPSIALQGE